MRPVTFVIAAAALAAASTWAGQAWAEGDLKSPDAFSGIADPAQRSAALFTEAGKVLQSPRCLNCHPVGNRPHHGNDGHLHVPAVQLRVGLAAEDLDAVPELGQLAGQRADVDALAAAVRLAPVGQQCDAQRPSHGRDSNEVAPRPRPPAARRPPSGWRRDLRSWSP